MARYEDDLSFWCDDRDYDDYRFPPMPKAHVLRFHREKNLLTKQMVWKVLRRGVLYEVPFGAEHQPTSADEVWLCREVNLGEASDDRIVVPVELKYLLFSGEKAFRFQADERRRKAGKSYWKAFLPCSSLSVWCVPDNAGSFQPSDDHEWWFCKFRLVAKLDDATEYLVIVVELVREDTEARDKYLAEKAEREAEQLRLKKAAQEKAEADRKAEAEALERWRREQAEREAREDAKDKFEDQFPVLAERLRKLDRLERLDRESLVSKLPSTGGGCGFSLLVRRRKSVLHSHFE